MYYLQSRYYDPNLCRFISADDFAYINTDTPMSVNAYAYCINNPLKYSDYTGTEAGAVIGSLIFYSFALLTGLFFIYIILEITIATMNGTAPTITFPSISFSTSVPTAAERADSKVKDTIKSAKYTQYWEATRKGTYVAIGKKLNFRTALARVLVGGDVFAVSKSAAHTLATTASGGKTPVGPEWDRDKKDVIGYYAHYHTANRNGAHIFYI